MSAAAIKAGKAYVEFSLRDRLDTGLLQARQKLLRWGLSLARIGSLVTAAAGGIFASLTAAAKAFADTGSEIYDLSRASGVGAKDLSALAFAAGESGAGLSDVANAMKGLARFTGQLNVSNKAALQTLDLLGIAADEFLKRSPYEKFLLVADALKAIDDPSQRAALGMQVLGRSAQSLGSLLADGSAGIRQLTADAERLGLVVTDREAQKADALGDAWGTVWDQIKRVGFVTGAIYADLLTEIGTVLQGALANLIAALRGVDAALAIGANAWRVYATAGQQAIGGLWDALVSNQWALAGQIMGATLNLAWQGSISNLKLMWVEFRDWLLRLFADLAEQAGNLPLVGGLSGAKGAASLFRAGATIDRSAAQAAEVAAIAQATSDLAALIDQAAKAREEAFRVKLPPTPSFGGGQAGAAATPLDPAFATGTFNAAAAQLLGRAGESTAERTAAAAEATVEKLDEVKGAVEALDFTDAE